MLRDYHASGRLARFISVRAERWDALLQVLERARHLTRDELLENLRIRYTIGDACRLSLPDRSISLITSNNTLEHVPAEILRGLLVEFRRLAATGGVMSHFIDMSDHFARLDPSITIYNYLRYSKRQWRWIDNTIQPQNRLRISHYRALYAELSIPISEERCWEGSVEALSKVDVHPDFAGIPLQELATRHCLLVSEM
jgi:ubiquinone/menaquinone biosynthesis C-methylase UbiE